MTRRRSSARRPTSAAAAKQMLARADRMLDNLDEVRQEDKYANISFRNRPPAARPRSMRPA